MDKPDAVFWSELLHKLVELVTPSAADILTSPAKIGLLLSICDDLEGLQKDVASAGIALAFKRQQIPGWTLVRREGSKYVEAGTIVSLLESLPVRDFVRVLPEVLNWSGSVSERRYLSLCELLGHEPELTVIRSSGATVFLRQKPQR